MSATTPAPSTPAPAAGRAAPTLLVACLCAQWCRTCDAYRDTLAAVRSAVRLAHPHAQVRYTWVDIEDESELVGDLDVEDFPTILLASDETVLFFGPVMPHAQTLERLVQSALAGAPPASIDGLEPDLLALPRRLRDHADL